MSREAAERVLAEHAPWRNQADIVKGCRCGERMVGIQRHAAHVAEALDAAGVLAGGVLDAVEALADEWERGAADATRRGYPSPGDGLTFAQERHAARLRALVAQHRDADGDGEA